VGSCQDKRPTLLDLRESGELEQKADVVLFLHREDYYDADSHMKGTVELIPAKGRNLRLGKTILPQNRFDEMRLDDWFGAWPEAPPQAQTSNKRRLR
jgi:replicative DNA helicase